MEKKHDILIIVGVVILICLGGFFLWNEHKAGIQKKLEYQLKYPYSCALPGKFWDTCVTTGTMTVDYPSGIRTVGNHPGTIGYYAFENNRTCLSVYYAVVNWDNRHVSTTDSDGLVHYIAEGYDSNNVWHQGSNYVKCGADKP